MNSLIVFVIVVIVLTLIENSIKTKRDLKFKIKQLESKIISKEFSITCLETQLLCKDMLIDLFKLNTDSAKEKEQLQEKNDIGVGTNA